MNSNQIRDELQDELLAELRRADPVEIDSLASATDPHPSRTLETILAGTAAAPQRGRQARMAVPVLQFASGGGQRWLSAAAAVAVVALVAAATIVAYDTGTGRDATAAVHQSVDATLELSSSATSRTTITYDFDSLDEPLGLTVEAAYSGGNVQYQLIPGPGWAQWGLPADAYTEIIVDGQSYRSVAEGVWEGPVAVPEAATAAGSGVPVQSNLTFGVELDTLRDLYDFIDMGDEDLDGIAVAHYRTHAPPAGAGAGLLLSFGMVMTLTGQDVPEQLDRTQLDVWVDDDDLIRRVSYTAAIDGSGSFTVVTDWGSFGKAPPITAPPS